MIKVNVSSICSSVVVLDGLGGALVSEIGGVIFLYVPSVVGVLDIETPAHHFSEAHGVIKSTK